MKVKRNAFRRRGRVNKILETLLGPLKPGDKIRVIDPPDFPLFNLPPGTVFTFKKLNQYNGFLEVEETTVTIHPRHWERAYDDHS